MPDKNKYVQGQLCWADLSTSDQNAGKTFYSTLFGWTHKDDPMGEGATYTTFFKGDKDVVACFQQMKDEAARGVPPHWNVYIAVDNVDAVAPKAEGLGGKVLMAPFDVFDAGRMAVVQDPTGAVLGLWQAKKHIGSRVFGEDNALVWAELGTNNIDAAGKFYTSLLGWKAEHMPEMSYTLFKVAGENVTGMMTLPPPMAKVPPHWLIYFGVNDCDAIVKKATSLGAKTLVPPTDIPNIGRFSVLQDPQGAVFAIIKGEPQPPKA